MNRATWTKVRRGLAGIALAGLFGVAGLGVLLVLVPATWLDQALVRTSHGHLMLTATSGRLWAGHGTLQAILPRGEAVTLARLRWQLSLAGVTAPRIGLSVLSEADAQPILTARLGPAGIEISSLRIELPAALLGALTPTLREAEPAGQLSVSARDIMLADGHLAGEVEILWHDAASSLSPVRPLGSYRLHLTGAGDRLDVDLSTPGPAALQLTGRGQWQAGGTLRFDGQARPDPAHAPELTPLLRILGREIAPGLYQLQLDPNVGAV